MILRPWKEIKRLNQAIERERDNSENFSTQLRELHEKCESLKKFQQETIILKSKLRKQTDADLLLVSLKMIAQIVGKSNEDLENLRTRQEDLRRQQQALMPNQYGGLIGLGQRQFYNNFFS